jgi:Domain of unknown function (DUF4375)
MKSIWSLLISLFSSGKRKNEVNQVSNNNIVATNVIERDGHLQLLIDKTQFNTMHSWEFGYAMLEPINKVKLPEEQLLKKLSPGQKALHFIWYMDAQVTNGGFIQFYWNDYAKYLPQVIDGLKLIGDNQMVDLIHKVEIEFKANISQFVEQKKKDDWEPLYENLKNFDAYDKTYFATHVHMMELIEKYAREHPDEFVKFK